MPQTKAQIEAVLREMAERYAARDVDGVLALFVDEGALVVGTGADEVRFGSDQIRAQVQRDISQADSIAIEFGDITVNVVGGAALCFTSAAFAGSAGGQQFELPVRLTAALVETGAGWRIAQFHTSVAFGDQAEGESFPA
jgi:uncharacterized protein (TIGR02246 family)